MIYLFLGLVLFLGIHSTRIFASDWRARQIERFGERAWRGAYSLFSLAGFVWMVWGYSLARATVLEVWSPPMWMRHVAALLTLLAFVLIAAAYVPRNHLKAKLGHPMFAGVKLWAFAHLLANGRAAEMLLFSAFLAWAVMGFIAARRRDRAVGMQYAPGAWGMTAVTVAVGAAAWAGFAFWAHAVLIGVRPFG